MSWFFFFFFKQKTAYEIAQSLVGSEMCIRDSRTTGVSPPADLRPLLFSPRSILRAMKLASSTCSHP